jgi:uncharacterized protein (TIGR02996 family)
VSLAEVDAEAPLRELLPRLVAVWRGRRVPSLGDLVEGVTAALLAEAPRPALGGSRKGADVAAWREVEEAHDLLDFPRLMAAARCGAQGDVARQVKALAAWEHPAMAGGLLALLEAPPYAGVKSRPMLEVVHSALEGTADARLVAPARALAKRYLRIVNSSTGARVIADLERVAAAVEARELPALDANEEAVRAAIEARLPAEHRVVRRDEGAAAALVETLLARVYADPDDDGARLVLADALLERGDEYGELIQLQVARSRGELTEEQAAREAALTTAERLAAWAHPLSSAGRCAFERGFPATISLYRSVARAVGAPGWATVRRVEGIGKLSKKAARELLTHPCFARVRDVGVLDEELFRAAGDIARDWTGLDLSANVTLAPAELARAASLRHLTLTLDGDAGGAADKLLLGLPALEVLRLRLSGRGAPAPVRIPASVARANIDGPLATGTFAGATGLRVLTLWTPYVAAGLLELPALTSLSTRARRYDEGAFASLAALERLELAHDTHGETVPSALLAPLRALRYLDAHYTQLAPGHLEPLGALEELRNHWTNVEAAPGLPRLHTFHCMMPAQVATLGAFLERSPALRVLELCWNSQTEMWLRGAPDVAMQRAWDAFAAAIAASSLDRWRTDDGVEVLRDEERRWSRLSLARARPHDWNVVPFAEQVVRTFPIRGVEGGPEELRERLRALVAGSVDFV